MNIDLDTGTAFGVISMHRLGDIGLGQFVEGAEDQRVLAQEENIREDATALARKWWPNDYEDLAAEIAGLLIGDMFALWETQHEDLIWEDADYTIQGVWSADLVVIRSPYLTTCRLCSPCLPGAGNLEEPASAGQRTYCLGPEWFDAAHPLPYDVYRAGTNQLVVRRATSASQVDS